MASSVNHDRKPGAEFHLPLKSQKIAANISGELGLAQDASGYDGIATPRRKDQRALGERIDQVAQEFTSICGTAVPTYCDRRAIRLGIYRSEDRS